MINIKETCIPGTVIRYGNSRRAMMNRMINLLLTNGFNEISIPILQFEETFKNKVGEENNNMMYTLTDRGNRHLCLAPEYTAVVQKLHNVDFKYQKNVKLFYVQECFRGEKPQLGRYRQFTQIGVEIINPTEHLDTHDGPIKHISYLQSLAEMLVSYVTRNMYMKLDTRRGLDYYKDGKGFEIHCPELGASQQVVGGGEYDHGIGFALGFDRLILLNEKNDKK